MTEYDSLDDAMAANDQLAEAVLRYRLLADAFTALPQLRSQLNPQLERAKAEIVRLRADPPRTVEDPVAPADADKFGRVVPFDGSRFRKEA